jgi:hypothetical protein
MLVRMMCIKSKFHTHTNRFLSSVQAPNCLVKLTPTGSACWYPPLRYGATYRGR